METYHGRPYRNGTCDTHDQIMDKAHRFTSGAVHIYCKYFLGMNLYMNIIFTPEDYAMRVWECGRHYSRYNTDYEYDFMNFEDAMNYEDHYDSETEIYTPPYDRVFECRDRTLIRAIQDLWEVYYELTLKEDNQLAQELYMSTLIYSPPEMSNPEMIMKWWLHLCVLGERQLWNGYEVWKEQAVMALDDMTYIEAT
jgi:hypothetical protein